MCAVSCTGVGEGKLEQADGAVARPQANGQLGGALRARALAHWRASSGWSADSDGPRVWQGGEGMHKLSPLVCAGVFVRGLSLFLTRRR